MSAEPELVTTEQAAELLGVTEVRIATWKHRGRITPVDYIRGRGRGGLVPVYDLADLRRLVTELG